MGQLTDTLRATLRDLAQSDARLYRGLQEELGDNPSTTSPPPALKEGDPPASREELEELSVAALWSLCKARGIKVLSRGPAPKQVEALLSHPSGPPLRSTLPRKGTKGTKGTAGAGKAATKTSAPVLQALVQLQQTTKGGNATTLITASDFNAGNTTSSGLRRQPSGASQGPTTQNFSQGASKQRSPCPWPALPGTVAEANLLSPLLHPRIRISGVQANTALVLQQQAPPHPPHSDPRLFSPGWPAASRSQRLSGKASTPSDP